MLKILANPSQETLIHLIHGVEDGASFVNKSSVLYMYHGTVYTALRCYFGSYLWPLQTLTANFCQKTCPYVESFSQLSSRVDIH